MAHTLAIGKLVRYGPGSPKIAIGTVAAIGDAGSFAVTLDSAGSLQMRNIQVIQLTQLGTVAAQVTGSGSSDGYVAVNVNRLGTFVLATPGGTVDLQYVAYGGAGSLPA